MSAVPPGIPEKRSPETRRVQEAAGNRGIGDSATLENNPIAALSFSLIPLFNPVLSAITREQVWTPPTLPETFLYVSPVRV